MITAYDQFMMALCLWREARGCAPDAMLGIRWVIMNRASDPHNRWPKTIHGVIIQPAQFSSINPPGTDPNTKAWPTEAHPSDWVAWQQCLVAASQMSVSDSTKGATNYESCDSQHMPDWADPTKLTAQIGPFRFYKL